MREGKEKSAKKAGKKATEKKRSEGCRKRAKRPATNTAAASISDPGERRGITDRR
jgi:hypothetical protein